MDKYSAMAGEFGLKPGQLEKAFSNESIEVSGSIPVSKTSESRLRAQYRKNLNSLKDMADKAKKTGKKVGGHTAEQLAVDVERYQAIADMTDDKLLDFVGKNYKSITDKSIAVDPRTF